MLNKEWPPYLTNLPPLKLFFSGYFLKFLTEQINSKLFCMVGVHSDFQRFANYWKNGLKVGQFVREGGHSLFNTLYFLQYKCNGFDVGLCSVVDIAVTTNQNLTLPKQKTLLNLL